MRRIHPAIAELQRRNRAAGRRLSPLRENCQHGHSDGNNSSNSVSGNTRRASPQAQGLRMSSAGAAPATGAGGHAGRDGSRPSMPHRFMSTAPTGGGDDNHRMTRDASRGHNGRKSPGRRENGKGRMEPRPPARRVPANPKSSIHTAAAHTTPPGNGDFFLAGDHSPSCEQHSSTTVAVVDAMKSKPASKSKLLEASFATPSNPRSGLGFTKNRSYSRKGSIPDVLFTVHEDIVEEEEEMKSVSEYADVENWNQSLPASLIALLEGESLEAPFTTNLWANAHDVEKRKVSGYYACIRCHVPVVSPIYQVNYTARGMAAFMRLNKKAVRVYVSYVPTPSAGRVKGHSALELHVRCRCCNGFLGILAPNSDLDLPEDLTHVFVVNSSCLSFMKGRRTTCRLDDIYDTENNTNDEKEDALGIDMDMDFGDPNIFEV